MIKFAYKYYLKFPPIARQAINFSISGFLSGITIDFYSPDAENILLGCDEVLNKKIFKWAWFGTG